MVAASTLWPAEHTEHILPLIERGWSGGQIAKRLNKTFGSSYSRNAVVSKTIRIKRRLKGINTGDPNRFPHRKGRKKPIMLPPSPPPVDTEVGRFRCVELEDTHCRWPFGDADITFCGNPRLKVSDVYLSSYCPGHYQLSVGTGTRSEREAMRVRRDV